MHLEDEAATNMAWDKASQVWSPFLQVNVTEETQQLFFLFFDRGPCPPPEGVYR